MVPQGESLGFADMDREGIYLRLDFKDKVRDDASSEYEVALMLLEFRSNMGVLDYSKMR